MQHKINARTVKEVIAAVISNGIILPRSNVFQTHFQEPPTLENQDLQ